MSPQPQPLSAAGAGQPSRSASCLVAKPSCGFQVLRIDGYSWTKSLPGGERITSEPFTVGGRLWCVDYYPNGVDPSHDESDSIDLYLRLVGVVDGYRKERVRAQYKFSLLDLTGTAVYERPAESGIFTSPAAVVAGVGQPQAAAPPAMTGQAYAAALARWTASKQAASSEGVGCGYPAFIRREEMERRRESLLVEDCLVVRCDVGVTEVAPMAVAAANPLAAARIFRGYVPPYGCGGYGYNGGEICALDGTREGGRGGGQEPTPTPPLDDNEFIRRCLAVKRARE